MPQTPGLRRQAEREFYYRALGGAFPQKRIDQLAREFYLLYLSQHGGAPPGGNSMPIAQLELVWLKQFVLTNGGTIPSGSAQHPVGFRSDLWRAALMLTANKTQVSKFMNDNRLTFYLNG